MNSAQQQKRWDFERIYMLVMMALLSNVSKLAFSWTFYFLHIPFRLTDKKLFQLPFHLSHFQITDNVLKINQSSSYWTSKGNTVHKMSHQHLENVQNAMREVPDHLMNIIMHYVTGIQNISAREISEPIVKPAISNIFCQAPCDNLFLLTVLSG